jgi:hypothetical protein
MGAIRKTGRGFNVYGEIAEHNGGTLCVQESSIAFEGAHVWLFHHGVECSEHQGEHHRPSPQLSVPQAEELIAALQAFVNDARADVLMEPAEVV